MLIFDIIITTIESLILSGFILTTFDLFYKKIFIILTILYITETFIFNNLFVNNFMLLIVELITTLTILYHYKKNITFQYFWVTCIGIGLILISNLISIIIVSIILNAPISSICNDFSFFVIATSLSKIINFILWIPAVNFFKKNENSLLLKKWWLLIIFLTIIIVMIIILIESIIFKKYTDRLLTLLIFGLIILLFLSIGIYYKINQDNKLQLKLTKKILKDQYLNKNYTKMNYLYNKTIEEKHKMIYLMIKFKNLLNNHQYEELKLAIEAEISSTNNLHIIKSTSNPFFDFKINEKLEAIKQKGYNIKTVFQLSEVTILTEESIVYDILSSIDWICQYSNNKKYISLFITHKQSYLLIEIKTYTIEDIVLKDLILINESIKKKFTLNNDLLTIRLLISID